MLTRWFVMSEPGDFGSVSRVLDSSGSGFKGNSGFGDDVIMVEIVGSNVIVGGLDGNEMSLENGGVFGFEGNVGGAEFVQEEVGVEDYGVTEDVVFLDNVGVERRDAVMGTGNEDRLGGREEASGSSGDKGCEMRTLSEVLSCGSEVSGGNFMAAAGLSGGEAEVIGGKRDCCLRGEKMGEISDGLALQIGFLNEDVSNASSVSGFRSNSDMEMTVEVSKQVFTKVKDRGLNGKDQVVHNFAFDAESTCLETVRSTSVETDTGATDTVDAESTCLATCVENHSVPNEADKEQMSGATQYGEAISQLVPSEADKPVKSGRRSWKRFCSGKQVMISDKPVEDHADVRSLDRTPTELILKFTEGKFVPSEMNLNKIFRRFGPIRECETEIDIESSCAKVVYKRCSDAKVALSSAGLFNIFGPMLVSFELSYVPSASIKNLPAATV